MRIEENVGIPIHSSELDIVNTAVRAHENIFGTYDCMECTCPISDFRHCIQ